MNNLTISNFKAFLNQVNLNFDSKNAMIYGENGSGKSSVYEAIKLWFFTDVVFNKRCDKTLTNPADIQNNKNDILDSYNHQKQPGTRFSLSLNGSLYSSVTPTGYNVCMINRTDVEVVDKVDLVDLLSNTLVGISDPATFISTKKQELEDLINVTVSQDFSEPDLEVTFAYQNPKWFLSVSDNKRHITRNADLSVYFNEGKLHVILIVLLLCAAQLNGKTELNKVLVLDDIVTSLDAANRTFLINYIHGYFTDWQKIIMTHSSSFFNQMDYSFRTAWAENDQWTSFRVLEHEDESSVIRVEDKVTGKYLRTEYNRGIMPHHTIPPSLPNEIRRRFEYLVSELSTMLSIGGSAETGQILKLINNRKDFYYYFDAVAKCNKSIFDMVDEIVAKIGSSPACTLKTELDAILATYSNSIELPKLHLMLQSLMVYQKVTMHAGSHATGSITPMTNPEMDRCISLIQKMETLMGSIVGRDMYSF